MPACLSRSATAGFFDSFKEASALAKHLSEAHAKNDNPLVRELADTHSKPFGVTDSPAEIEKATVDTLHAAVAALEAKSPDDLPAYKQLVIDVCGVGSRGSEGRRAQREQRARHGSLRTRHVSSRLNVARRRAIEALN